MPEGTGEARRREREPAGVTRVLVVDDEPLARDCVADALSRAPDVEIVGECGSGREALDAIRRLRPDVVFLDIRMPDLSGLEVAQRLGARGPAVVFVTAYDEHALRAFDLHAVDYVVKPFDDARLLEALEWARARAPSDRAAAARGAARDLAAAEAAGDPPRGPDEPVSRLTVREGRHIRFVPTERIRWLESERNYVVLHTETGSVRMRSTLRDLSARLDPARFVRVHRSRVVNLDHVDRVEPWFNGTYRVVLLDGTTLRVSRSYRRDLLLPAR